MELGDFDRLTARNLVGAWVGVGLFDDCMYDRQGPSNPSKNCKRFYKVLSESDY